MPRKKISELPEITLGELSGTEPLAIVDNGLTGKVQLDTIRDYAIAGVPLGDYLERGQNLADLEDAEAATGNLRFKFLSSEAVVRTVTDVLKEKAVSVLDFGAVGDGLVDDGPAFQKAIDYCLVNYKPLYVPGQGLIFNIETTVTINPHVPFDESPRPAYYPGAYGAAPVIFGDGMAATFILPRVPNAPAFDINVEDPVPYAYRASQGLNIHNIAFLGDNSVDGAMAIRLFNAHQAKIVQCHFRNISGTALKMINGIAGTVPDSGWNMVHIENCWFEGNANDGDGFALDATGEEGRNEGSFTHLSHCFFQANGRNQYYTITGVSTANPAIVSVNLNQMPAASPTQTQHSFAFGDRIKSFGVKKTATMAADPLSMTINSKVVSVTSAAHGLAAGDVVTFSGATATGGLTISGAYQITTVSTNAFTILSPTAATSTATGGGAAITLVSPMKALDDVDYWVGPSPTATTFALYSASGSSVSLTTDPFATTASSATVTVTRTAHGLSVGQFVVFRHAQPVGGITIDKGYTVASTPTADTFTITHSSAATSTDTGGGTVAKYQRIVSFNGASIGTWVSDLAAPATINTDPFATTASSATVTVTHTTHGAAAGDLVTFAGASAVGGITIDGQYRIVTVPNANTYTISHSSPAVSTATGGGAAVTAQYTYRSTVHGEVGFYEPKSGAMRYKGQLLKMHQCGFTVNQNCAQYIPGASGAAIGVYCDQVTWENNYRRHFFAKGGINFTFISNQFHGNNQSGLRQWRLAEFDCTEYAFQNVLWINTKIRAKECPSIAFMYRGTQSTPNAMRVRNALWSDYDYFGQQRFNGVISDPIRQDLILTYVNTTGWALRPDQNYGSGNKTPLRLRGPNTDGGGGSNSTSGEWVPWQLTSNNGIIIGNAGLAASTVYQVYLYDNDGVPTLMASEVLPVIDAESGYMVMTGDPTHLWVGRVQTDAGSLFVSTGHQFLNPMRIGAAQAGGAAWMWYSEADRQLKIKGGTLPSSMVGSSYNYWPTFEASKTHDWGSIAAGATASTTLTTGVTCSLRDYTVGVSMSIDTGGLLLHSYISAANTITVVAWNPTGAAIDLASATLGVLYQRR